MNNLIAALLATDGLAIAMFCVMAFSFGVILTLVFVMMRNSSISKTQNSELEQLLSEIEQEEQVTKIKETKSKPNPVADWEKDPDWWKS